MLTALTHVTILVDDQDEALEFYRDKLGLVVRADEEVEEAEGRWVTVSPGAAEYPQITFIAADTPEQRERVGSQVADHVNLVFSTDDFEGEYQRLREAGVEFRGEPAHNPWGTEVLFEDPFGNVHDLLEPAE